MPQIIKKIPEIINDFFKKHWFWYSIIIALPTAWFSVVLPFWGNSLKLQNENNLTSLGNIFSFIIVTFVAIIVFVNNWYSSKTGKGRLDKLQSEVDYLGIINENIDKVCDEKYDQLRRTIVEVKSNEIELPRIVTKPGNQLKRIISGMTCCLVKFMECSENSFVFKDFIVSIAYNFPIEKNNWEWIDGMMERDLTLDELLSPECDSTFKYLIKSHKPYYFNNKKEDAKREHCYYYNKQDELNEENKEVVGSIFCYNFKIKSKKETYIDAYLSISTNKKRFSIDDEEVCKNTRDNMISLVKETFGKRIGIELCLLYLEYIKERSGMKE